MPPRIHEEPSLSTSRKSHFLYMHLSDQVNNGRKTRRSLLVRTVDGRWFLWVMPRDLHKGGYDMIADLKLNFPEGHIKEFYLFDAGRSFMFHKNWLDQKLSASYDSKDPVPAVIVFE